MLDFKGSHLEGETVPWTVRWYCRYGISYSGIEQMLAERGLSVDHTTIHRWETSECGLRSGYETPWICASNTWPNFEAAKAEFEYYTKLCSDGLTSQQLEGIIEDQRNPPANDAERVGRAAWRKQLPTLI